MTTVLLVTLPFQLVCRLIIPGVPPGLNNDSNIATNRSSPQVQFANISENYVVPNATATLLVSESLKLVCQLLVTNNTDIAKDGALVVNETSTPSPETTIIPKENVTWLEPTSTSGPIVEDEVTTLRVRNLSLLEGYVFFPEDHAAYKIYKEDTSWTEARDRCISEDATLAIADSVVKILHINSLRDKQNGKWLHVGIHQPNATSERIRVDNGLSAMHAPWVRYQPNTTPGCAGITLGSNALMMYPCDRWGEHFVCEVTM